MSLTWKQWIKAGFTTRQAKELARLDSGAGTSVAPADLPRAEYKVPGGQVLAASDQIEWVLTPGAGGGDDDNPPLDVTDPKNPTVIAAGIYAIGVTIESQGVAEGARFLLNLSLDDWGFGWIAEQAMDLSLAAARCNASQTVYLPAGAVISGYTSHDIGEDTNFAVIANVQKIA